MSGYLGALRGRLTTSRWSAASETEQNREMYCALQRIFVGHGFRRG
jgi:hypothetical protein